MMTIKKEQLRKTKELSNLRIYGVTNPAQAQCVKDKTKNCSVPSGTCLWRYVEPGTLRWYDLFMTDSEYKIIDLMA